MPKIIIQNASDYVPTVITVDGSQSKSENGEIKKFIYNFGEGKPDTVGDAIYEYQYNTPGEKEITLTIVNES
jgi:PKD domain